MFETMKITENIKDLASAFYLMEQLESPEYLEANRIAPEEVEAFKAEITEQIKNYQDQAKSYINYKLKERQELLLPVAGIDAEIERLQKLREWMTNKGEKIKQWIDFLLRTFGIDKMQTDLHKLSYLASHSVLFTDIDQIPDKFKTKEIIENIKISKADIKKAINAWEKVPWAIIETKQNLQIK